MMETADNIVLIGYRCSGKTTVGALLAEAFDREFIDSDALIERRFGLSIGEIFADRGEAAFRQAETEALEELVDVSQSVISLGGGAVERPGNRDVIRGLGVIVWLSTTAEELYRRLTADARLGSARPALTDLDARREIQDKLSERSNLYAELATHTIETTGRTPQQVLTSVLQLLST